MSIVVFCGPTISMAEVRQEIQADVRGPAARGDLLEAALEQPHAIVLIDGYFDRVPSVWHKEILWAMTQGIHVFGASSMGALRAAELAPFGMVGIGEIFEAFRNHELEDDDEVAVVHSDESSGYRRASEALVNIRWTLRRAEREGVIDTPARLALEAHAKETPYDRRDLRLVLDECHSDEVGAPCAAALREWLPRGKVDQKRDDAISTLRHVSDLSRAGWVPKAVDFVMAETDGWTALFDEIEGTMTQRTEHSIPRMLEDELRARGLLGQVLAGATMRLLAAERLRQAGLTLNARAVEAWIDDFRRERGLLSAESFDAWIEHAGLDEADLEPFFRRESVVRATRVELRNRIGEAVEDELRARNKWREITGAAAHKETALAHRGLSTPTLDNAGLGEQELWSWFFSEHLRMPVPRSMADYAAKEGTTVDDLRISALRELLFARVSRNLPHPTTTRTPDA